MINCLSWNVLDPGAGFQALEPEDGGSSYVNSRTVANPASNCAFSLKAMHTSRRKEFPLYTTSFSRTSPEQNYLTSDECSPRRVWIEGENTSPGERAVKAESEFDCTPFHDPPPGKRRFVEFEGKWCHDFITGLKGSSYSKARQWFNLELLRIATRRGSRSSEDWLRADVVCLQEVDESFYKQIHATFHTRFFIFFEGEFLTMVRRKIVAKPPVMWSRWGRVTQVVCRLTEEFGGLGVSVFNLHFLGGAKTPKEDIQYIQGYIRETSPYFEAKGEPPVALSLVMGDFNFSLEDYGLQKAFEFRIQGTLTIDSILVDVQDSAWPSTLRRPSVQTLMSKKSGWNDLPLGRQGASIEQFMKVWGDMGGRSLMTEHVASGSASRKGGRKMLWDAYTEDIKGLHNISDHPPLYLSIVFDDDVTKPRTIYQEEEEDAAMNLYRSFNMWSKPLHVAVA